MNHLKTDLPRGVAGEDYVLEVLQSNENFSPLFKDAYRKVGKCSAADIFLDLQKALNLPIELVMGIEVKNDEMSVTTGNVAIEQSCYRKPSGIELTTATVWVQIIPEGKKTSGYSGVWAIPTAMLKENISKKKYRTVRGGDDFAAQLVLIPVKDFVLIEGAQRIADAPLLYKKI